jgi:hypothetical protein
MKILKNIWLIAFLFIYTGSIAQSHREINLGKRKYKNSKSAEIDPIQVVLNVDTSQKQTDKGIRFSIKIKNDSASNIVILNPLDVIRIDLINKAGNSIIIPYGSRFGTHTSGSHNRPISFTIEKIVSKDKELKLTDLADVDTINVPSKSSFNIYLNINRCLDLSSDSKNQQKIVPIPIGKYRLLVILGIVSGKDKTSTQTRTTFTLLPLSINYSL